MKKIIALMLALTMSIALASCGASNNNGSGTNAGSSSEGTSDSADTDSGSSEKYRVAYFNRDDTDEFLNELTSMVEALCVADDTIEFVRYDATSDATTQMTQIEDAVTKGVDFVLLSTQDKEAMLSKVSELNDLNIPVACIDIDLQRDAGAEFVFIGSDNYTLAYTTGEYLAKIMPDDAKIIYLRFTIGSETSRLRDLGMMEALEDSGKSYEIISTMEYPATQVDAMSLTEDLLQVYGDDWDVILTHNDKGAYGAISAVEAAGYKTEDKIVMGFDGEVQAMEMIKRGQMSASIMQNKQGMADKSYEIIKLYQGGGSTDEEIYFIDGVMIDESNVASYLD